MMIEWHVAEWLWLQVKLDFFFLPFLFTSQEKQKNWDNDIKRLETMHRSFSLSAFVFVFPCTHEHDREEKEKNNACQYVDV